MVVAQGPLEKTPFPDSLDYSKQSVEAPGTKKPGQTGHFQNAIWGLLDSNSPRVFTNAIEIFDAGLAKSADKPFTGHRPITSTNPLTFSKQFVWETYRQVDEHRRNIGSALHKLFKEGKAGGGDLATVGIWSQNRPEWQHIDLALQAYGMIGVSLYDTFGAESVEHIIQHANLSVIFATSNHLATLLSLAPKLSMIQIIVSIDDLTTQAKNVLQIWAKQHKIQVMELSEVKALGKAHRIDPITAKPDQMLSICYTSGTTSTPKGVVLYHSTVGASVSSFCHGAAFEDDGVMLSYLPLAHIYERVAELLVIATGGMIGYFTGDPLRLLEDAQILRPTYFPSVPRVLNRIYQGAMLAGDVPGLRGNIFRKACEVKLKQLKATGNYTHIFWDKLVFRKVQAVLGGRIRDLTSGSAPIRGEVLDFLTVAFACNVVEGYGLTETCASATRAWNKDPNSGGTVGAPQPTCEIKLVDIPSMSYFSEDKPHSRGEICVRGTSCFTTYHKDPKSTRDTVDEEGWIHTGDVGEVDSCGRFKVIDRVKNIMKLSQGEYVALEKIENMYAGSSVVEQIYVHGDSLQSYLLAVVVPEPITFASIASKVMGKSITPADSTELINAANHEKIAEKVLLELRNEADKAGLKGFERVKRIFITLDAFTVDNGLLTPTFKIKRKAAAQKYQQQLDDLYALGPLGDTDAFKL